MFNFAWPGEHNQEYIHRLNFSYLTKKSVGAVPIFTDSTFAPASFPPNKLRGSTGGSRVEGREVDPFATNVRGLHLGIVISRVLCRCVIFVLALLNFFQIQHSLPPALHKFLSI